MTQYFEASEVGIVLPNLDRLTGSSQTLYSINPKVPNKSNFDRSTDPKWNRRTIGGAPKPGGVYLVPVQDHHLLIPLKEESRGHWDWKKKKPEADFRCRLGWEICF